MSQRTGGTRHFFTLFWMGEYQTGVFRRRFNVPQLIDRDKIKARLHNGVLDIELPKAEQAKPRRIEIATGS